MKRAVALLVASNLVVASLSPAVFAKTSPDDETTSALVDEAKAHAAHGDKAGAIQRFQAAYRLSRSPAVGLQLTRAEADAGHLVQAMMVLRDVATAQLPDHAPADDTAAVAEAARTLPTMEARVPRIRVDVDGAEASEHPSVKLSGQAIAAGAWIAVDPGSYKIEASADGKPTATQDVKVAESDRQTFRLSVAPPPKPVAAPVPVAKPAPKPTPTPKPRYVSKPARPQRDEGVVHVRHPSSGQSTLGAITIGAGVIGLALGGVTGDLALNKKSDIDSTCDGVHCPPSAQADVDTAKKLALVSTIGFVAGGVLTVGGLVLVLTAPKKHSGSGRLQLSVGAGSAHLSGAF